MKKIKHQKSIRNTQSKFHCEFYINEHVIVEEVSVRVKYRPRDDKNRRRKLNLYFLWSSIIEILKTVF